MSSPDDVVVAVWREQAPRLVGGLVRLTRDVHLAEDLAHDAMVAALEQWPVDGVPDNPAAWLMAVARRRAVDHVRRAERHGRAEASLAQDLRTRTAEEQWMPGAEAAVDHVEDDVLRLMFLTCHPALTAESQVALTLRLVGGLTSREIARALLVPEPTVVRRITRAKSTLAAAARSAGPDGGSPFDVPGPAERRERLPAVLHVVYLVFTEGYAATGGADLLRPALTGEAIRLGRLVAGLVPGEPEVHGLLALMWFQVSRSAARTDSAGDPVLLPDQDRTRWDRSALQRGTEALGRARAASPPGPFALQAAIAACHAQAGSVATTDWTTVAALYDALAVVAPSPVVRLNRAVAHGRAGGPGLGLRLVDELVGEPALRGHHLLPSVRGDLLEQLGRHAEARVEFGRAAEMAGNARERRLLLGRAGAP